MNVVIVDHVFLEDDHIRRLRSLGDVQVFKEPPATLDELKERLRTADVAIVGWTDLTGDVIESAERLKMVSIWATTCHYVNSEAAAKRGIVVTHVPGYSTESVAEHAFALLLASVRKLAQADSHVRQGGFDWRPFGGRELAGKTLGVVGTGAIGCRVAELAKAFRMNVLGYDICPNPARAREIGFIYVGLSELLKQSDVVTLHVTLTSGSMRLLGKSEIESMKRGAIVVNTSQGRVIDEKALVDALRSGRLAYAGLDVFAQEPPAKDNPLFTLENVVLSPHIGFNTVEAAKRCTDICIDNVVKFLEGHPQNICAT